MPQANAEQYCLDIVHGIAGLFDVDPGVRPTWLSDIPEKFCSADADFSCLIQELVEASIIDSMMLVSLDTPIALSVKKYGKLTLSAHLVSLDYKYPEGNVLYEKGAFMFLEDTLELKGATEEISINDISSDGHVGNEIPVCSSLIPMPFGTWHGDYLSTGLTVAAPYLVPNHNIQCESDSIDVLSDNHTVSKTYLWNDNWKPPHPKDGSTRCGCMTIIDQDILYGVMDKLDRKLAYFAHLSIWNREKDYGDYSKVDRTFYMLYCKE